MSEPTPTANASAPSWAGVLAAWWGIAGALSLLGSAVARLLPMAWHALTGPLGAVHWLFLAVWLPFSFYAEGYKAFHKQYAPRVASRAVYLSRHPRPLWVLLAPFFCLGLFHAHRRRLVVGWVVVLGVVAIVAFVRHLPQPWRGLVDAGVVPPLAYGGLACLWLFIGGLRSGRMPGDPALPQVAPSSPAARARSA